MDNIVLPLELMDKSIGKRLWIVLKDQSEIIGNLVGFDEFVNIVLSDVQEKEIKSDGQSSIRKCPEMLLNGASVSVLIPNYEGDAF
ncbi:hypothetical protein MIR68_008763 [Amoeboaphelidium protococcarum]|nr:hypothetical protein MIR68_008763 [Amoeboaphelidium protococcarum]